MWAMRCQIYNKFYMKVCNPTKTMNSLLVVDEHKLGTIHVTVETGNSSHKFTFSPLNVHSHEFQRKPFCLCVYRLSFQSVNTQVILHYDIELCCYIPYCHYPRCWDRQPSLCTSEVGSYRVVSPATGNHPRIHTSVCNKTRQMLSNSSMEFKILSHNAYF